MCREGDVALRRVHDLLCALLDGSLELGEESATVRRRWSQRPRTGQCRYQRDNVARLVVQPVGQLLVICNKMGDVDITVVSLGQDVLPYLVSVYEGVF